MGKGIDNSAVFISYPRADEQIAGKLRECLVTLTTNIDPILDQEIIKPGEDFESDIADAIRRSRWFALICNGEAGPEKNFDWCYYEAGQFRSVMSELFDV